MAYEIERDLTSQPSLRNMVERALHLLSKQGYIDIYNSNQMKDNSNGFFILVEASGIDTTGEILKSFY